MSEPLETFPPEAMPSEDDLLDRISRTLRTHRGGLAAIARGEGASPEDAVDCVQDALCTLLLTARRGALPDDERECLALLTTMVRNVARNSRRRHFRARPHDSLDALESTSIEALRSDDLIARAEDHVRLQACVEDLCEIQKAVVTLRMLEEQPGEDVAKALGISPGHVAVLLHRAKQALRTCMTAG